MLPPDRLLAVVFTTALGAARALPVVWMVAPLGGPRLPAAVRVGFALLLALVASPVLAASAGADRLADVSALRFALMVAREVFLQIGGVPRVVDALVGSYEALPIAGGLGEVSARRAAFVVAIIAAKLVAAGVALAAPVIVALWLTDLALGLIARAAPSVPVYFVGLPIKGLLAIGIVLLGLGALEAAIAGNAATWLQMLRQTTDAFR
jgi:type III secretory pathway component EscT